MPAHLVAPAPTCRTCKSTGREPFRGSGPSAFERAYLHEGAEPCADCGGTGRGIAQPGRAA